VNLELTPRPSGGIEAQTMREGSGQIEFHWASLITPKQGIGETDCKILS
jgi:hypothetical protein